MQQQILEILSQWQKISFLDLFDIFCFIIIVKTGSHRPPFCFIIARLLERPAICFKGVCRKNTILYSFNIICDNNCKHSKFIGNGGAQYLFDYRPVVFCLLCIDDLFRSLFCSLSFVRFSSVPNNKFCWLADLSFSHICCCIINCFMVFT